MDAGNVKVEKERITPDRAAALLAGNTANRRVRKSLVQQYARDMATGQWAFNGDAIRLNGDGSLLDGQHRLLACVESGASFDTLVISGVPHDAMLTIDTGAKRGIADHLSLVGEKNVSRLAALARIAWLWGRQRTPQSVPLSGVHPSTTEIVQFLERWPQAREAARRATAFRTQTGMPGGVIGAFALNAWLATKDDELVDFYLASVTRGENPDSAGYSLWRKCLQWHQQKNHTRPYVLYLALLIKGWNAEIEGEIPKLWRWHRGGQNKESFPVLLDLNGDPFTPVK